MVRVERGGTVIGISRDLAAEGMAAKSEEFRHGGAELYTGSSVAE